MNAGRQTKMLRGAVWACAIPMGLGLIGLSLIIFDLMYYDQKKFIVRTHHFFTRPIVACFILGTPLTAWIACRRLRQISSLEKLRRWGSSAVSALIGSTLVHIGGICLYAVYVALFVDLTGGGYDMSQPDGELLLITFRFLVTNILPWLFITLPLSLLCATIFWKITKFPEDTDVF